MASITIYDSYHYIYYKSKSAAIDHNSMHSMKNHISRLQIPTIFWQKGFCVVKKSHAKRMPGLMYIDRHRHKRCAPYIFVDHQRVDSHSFSVYVNYCEIKLFVRMWLVKYVYTCKVSFTRLLSPFVHLYILDIKDGVIHTAKCLHSLNEPYSINIPDIIQFRWTSFIDSSSVLHCVRRTE